MIPQGHQATEKKHEHKDVDVLGVSFVAGIVFLLLAMCFLTARGVLSFTRKHHPPVVLRYAVGEQSSFPQPRLQVVPTADLAVSKEGSEVTLHSYGWIDRRAGLAHIPIERAMQLLVERGLPRVGEGQTRLQLMQARPVTDVQPANPVTSPAPEGSATP